jgi:TetR/AcrR family transcriptional regulator
MSTREKILDAAERRFAERGFSATSLGDIADDVGIRTPSLYKHFEGKQALYDAVMERLVAPFARSLGALLARPAGPDEAEENLLSIASLYTQAPNLARLVQHAALTDGPEVEGLLERFFAPLFARAQDLTEAVPYLGAAPRMGALDIVVGFHSLISGYVTLASLHARLLGEDPLGEAALARQREFLRVAARALWRPEAP